MTNRRLITGGGKRAIRSTGRATILGEGPCDCCEDTGPTCDEPACPIQAGRPTSAVSFVEPFDAFNPIAYLIEIDETATATAEVDVDYTGDLSVIATGGGKYTITKFLHHLCPEPTRIRTAVTALDVLDVGLNQMIIELALNQGVSPLILGRLFVIASVSDGMGGFTDERWGFNYTAGGGTSNTFNVGLTDSSVRLEIVFENHPDPDPNTIRVYRNSELVVDETFGMDFGGLQCDSFTSVSFQSAIFDPGIDWSIDDWGGEFTG